MLYLDTDAKTVTFDKNTTLTLAQIWSLIELMDDDDEDDPLFGLDISEAGRSNDSNTARQIVAVQSDSGRGKYAVVEFMDGTYACSCFDWIHRKQFTGQPCKHITRTFPASNSFYYRW